MVARRDGDIRLRAGVVVIATAPAGEWRHLTFGMHEVQGRGAGHDQEPIARSAHVEHARDGHPSLPREDIGTDRHRSQGKARDHEQGQSRAHSRGAYAPARTYFNGHVEKLVELARGLQARDDPRLHQNARPCLPGRSRHTPRNLQARRPAPHGGPRGGRPENVYKLTPAAYEHFPHAHRELASELVEFLSEAQLKRFFERRAARLEADYAPRLAGLDFEGRVRELAKLATEHGHMAEVVELPTGGLAIRHCNCPIQDVAARTGLPCVNEQQMYERLLGAPVNRSTWMREKASDCTYEVKESGGKVG